jgi:hypothetical protein
MYEVWELFRKSTHPSRLAASFTVEPKSLSAIPGYLYWTEGGHSREAKIE